MSNCTHVFRAMAMPIPAATNRNLVPRTGRRNYKPPVRVIIWLCATEKIAWDGGYDPLQLRLVSDQDARL